MSCFHYCHSFVILPGEENIREKKGKEGGKERERGEEEERIKQAEMRIKGKEHEEMKKTKKRENKG